MGFSIHDDISLIQFVIPGLTRNPVFFPPGKRPSWAGGWIPAFAGMTPFAAINVAVYNRVEKWIVLELSLKGPFPLDYFS